MKIYFLINSSYPRYAGGIETWLYNVSQKLCNKCDITIISHDNKDYPILFTNISTKIKFKQYKTFRSYKLLNSFIRGYLMLLDFFIGSYSMGAVLKKIIPRDEECFIIALDSMFCVKAGLIGKSKNSKVKLVSSVRGPHGAIYSKSYKLLTNLLLNFEINMLKKVDCIWSNGYDTIDLIANKGLSSKLMKNGIDFQKLNSTISSENFSFLNNDNSISIACVGTLLPIKGIYELIDAASYLRKIDNLEVNLYFIGKGDNSDFVKFAEKKDIKQFVHFMGHLSNPVEFVKKCTLSACLSGGSGMSMAALECMTTGVPIIAWDSPVYRQFNKDMLTMHLVKENDSIALSKGIFEMIHNYDFYLDLAQNAINESKKYDWSIVCDDLLNYLRNDC